MTTAKREGAGGFVVVNLCALVSTKPRGLGDAVKVGVDPVGPLNDAFVEAAFHYAAGAGNVRSAVVVGWGGSVHQDNALVRALVLRARACGLAVLCLGTNGDGTPCHPLRLAKTTPLVPYPPPGGAS